MVEATYWIEENDSVGAKTMSFKQIEEKGQQPLEWDIAVPQLKYASAIPTFRPRKAVIEEKEKFLNKSKKGPTTLQDAIASTIETAVDWWRNPAVMLGWIMEHTPKWPQSIPRPVAPHPVEEISPLPSAQAPILPELRDNMETPESARRQLRTNSFLFGRSPIRSDVEQETGLAVLLNDQFQQVAYIV